jgi:hypothetical protein
MARLEKRRMTESANNSSATTIATVLKPLPSSTLVMNGLPTSHSNTNEIENLLYKHEHDPTNQQYAVTIPENILLNQQMSNSIAHFTSSIKRRCSSIDDHSEQTTNGSLLSPHKKTRIGIVDGTKMPQTAHPSSNKSSKKNRNKQQQQQQTIIKTAASGIFPQQPQTQQTVTLQNIDESSDDVSKVNFYSSYFFRWGKKSNLPVLEES